MLLVAFVTSLQVPFILSFFLLRNDEREDGDIREKGNKMRWAGFGAGKPPPDVTKWNAVVYDREYTELHESEAMCFVGRRV
ncbi:hypothetical protein BKA65DRAFT_519891, partial [Rhexocercosporidium sp. MPI-PUGE-AT-0058]